ncbi:hypothetical protein LTR28_000545 [Elasticomyces elasticus]|nr:hypothetical protein LTR28_000545 [Elasticomyces elasticus]
MIYSTQIARKDGTYPRQVLVCTRQLILEAQSAAELGELKNEMRNVLKHLTPTSHPSAALESDQYTMHYLMRDNLVYFVITERSYPKKLAATYLRDISDAFVESHNTADYESAYARPYCCNDFDSTIQRMKKDFQDSRTNNNLEKLNSDLKDVTQVMTKNIQDLLYRGDSLEKMGDMSQRLKDESKKYKRAAVRINWELLLKQYGPFAALGLFVVVFLYWRFLA